MPVGWSGYEDTTATATGYYITTSANSATSSWTDPWHGWNTGYTTYTASTTVPTSVTWHGWNGVYDYDLLFSTPPPAPPTPEQIAAARFLEQREQQAQDQAEAIAKAQALLHAMLTSEQIATLAAQHWFEVVSQKGHRYRIHQGQVRNIRRVNPDGYPGAGYCIHPSENVPDADAMLAQKLLLETNEEQFLSIANRF